MKPLAEREVASRAGPVARFRIDKVWAIRAVPIDTAARPSSEFGADHRFELYLQGVTYLAPVGRPTAGASSRRTGHGGRLGPLGET